MRCRIIYRISIFTLAAVFVFNAIGCGSEPLSRTVDRTGQDTPRDTLRKATQVLIESDKASFIACFDNEFIDAGAASAIYEFNQVAVDFETALIERFGDDALQKFADEDVGGNVEFHTMSRNMDEVESIEVDIQDDTAFLYLSNSEMGRMKFIDQKRWVLDTGIPHDELEQFKNMYVKMNNGIATATDMLDHAQTTLHDVKLFLVKQFWDSVSEY